MAKTADEFLNDLAERDLVPAEIIASLRRQVAGSSKPVAAATLAKLLTDKGQLTAAQAQRILGSPVGAPAMQHASQPTHAANKSPAPKPADDLAGLAPLDDGGLMPLDDLTPLDSDGLAPLDDLGMTLLEDVPAPTPKPAAPAAPAKPLQAKHEPPQAKSKPAAARPAAAAPSKPVRAKTQAAIAPLAELSPTDGLAPLDDLTQPSAPAATGPVDLLADASLESPLAAASVAQPADPQASQPAKKKSSLGIVLGLLAVVLAIGGGAAAFVFIPRGTGDAEFDLAAADYQAKSYDAAIAKYDAALAKYPQSPRASLARVQRGAARVLAARAQSPRDWQPVLAAAKESLPPIGGEAELSQVHAELAPLLSEMAVALATGARSPESATPAREALALADDGRFVPGQLRDWQKLESAGEALARLDYDADVVKTRDAAGAAIKKAIDAGDVAAAFAERDKLRTTHSSLLDDAAIADLGKSLAAAAVSKVTSAQYAVKAETTEPRPAIVGQLLLVRAPAMAQSGGETAVIVAAGSAWGLDAASGAVRWRRPVGASSAATPVRQSSAADNEVLLVDGVRNELLSLTPATGALRWRHPLPGPAAGPPLVVGERVVVTTKAGQMLALDARSGDGLASLQLPQSASTSAAVDAAGKLVYQVADDSLVYVIGAADLQCTGAAYLGHHPASVSVPPAVLAKQVVVAVNRLPASASLRPIAIDAGGLLQVPAPSTEVTGVVSSPLVVLEGWILVATDAGRVVALETAADPSEGLKQVAAADAGSRIVARSIVPAGDQILVGGEGLRLLTPPGSGGMRQQWAAAAEGTCIARPWISGSRAIVAHVTPGQSGVQVAAVDLASGNVAWQSTLAVPLTGVVASGENSVSVVSSSGAVTQIGLADLQGLVAKEPAGGTPMGQPTASQFASVINLPSGMALLVPSGQPSELAALDPGATAPRVLSLPGQLAAAPLPWRDGIVVACTSGAIAWLDPASGGLKADPLQLNLLPGERLTDCRLGACGAGGNELIVAERRGTLHHVVLATDPQAQLVVMGSAKIEGTISGLAAVEKSVGVLDRRGQWHSFSLPGLGPKPAGSLGGRSIVVGPVGLGGVQLLVTDHDELIALNEQLEAAWKVPLAHGSLAGKPVAESARGTTVLLATKSGWLYRVALDTGEEVAAVNLAEPLAGTPLVLAPFALVPAADGTLLKVSLAALAEPMKEQQP